MLTVTKDFMILRKVPRINTVEIRFDHQMPVQML